MPTRIEYCDETINPLGHGCYGPGGTKEAPAVCAYCYAAIMAKRNMRGCELCKQFVPHTHFEQLEKLTKWKKPRTIFVQSMGDLFHDAIPDEWIKAVFEACGAAPWHRYLLLSKNHSRLVRLANDYALPQSNNYWYGTTITRNQDNYVWGATNNFFVSVEPILEDMSRLNSGIDYLGALDANIKWVIVGAMTGTEAKKHQPKREWIENIAAQCRAANVPLFMKNSLRGLMGDAFAQETPW